MPRPNMLHRSITSWLSNDKSQPFWFCFAALCFLRHILLVCPSDLLQWCTSFSNLLLSTNGGRFNPCASLSSSTEVVKRVPKGKSFWISFDSHAASSQNTVRKFTGWPWLFQQIFEAKQNIIRGLFFWKFLYPPSASISFLCTLNQRQRTSTRASSLETGAQFTRGCSCKL